MFQGNSMRRGAGSEDGAAGLVSTALAALTPR